MSVSSDIGSPVFSRRAIVASAIVGLALFAVLLPLMGRSIYVDEAMLLANLPLAHLSDAFGPLLQYDQASPPLFTLLANALNALPPYAFRCALVAISLPPILFSLRLNLARPIQYALVLAALFTQLFFWREMSEIKHYSFEQIGFFIAIAWFVGRDRSTDLRPGDLGLLIVAELLGFSTIIIAGICLGLFVLESGVVRRKLPGQATIISGAVFLVVTVAYYGLTKHMTVIQLTNYSQAYHKGTAEGLVLMVRAALSDVGPLAVPAMLASLWILANSFAPQNRRFLRLAIVTAAAFVVLTAAHIYPGYQKRQVLWVSTFAIFGMVLAIVALGHSLGNASPPPIATRVFKWQGVVFDSATRALGRLLGIASRERVLTLVLVVLLMPPVVFNVYTLARHHRPTESTDNGPIIAFLEKAPPATVAMWNGAEPVFQYYLRDHPGLRRDRLIGMVGSRSVAVPPVPDTVQYAAMAAKIEPMAQTEGGWSRFNFYRQRTNFIAPAVTMLDAAPRGVPFYVFASNASLDPAKDDEHFTSNLLAVMTQRRCGVERTLDLEMAYLLKVTCPSR